MARFASAEDLGRYLGETIAAADARAELLLDLASAAVQEYTGQTLEAVVDETITLRADGAATLLLPETPVTAVGTITQDGQPAIAPASVIWRRDGRLSLTGGSRFGTEVTVTYSHGFATIPDSIRAVVLSLAGRLYQNPTGAVSESIGTYSIQNARSVALELTGAERVTLDRYRLFDLG